jgi:phosphatidylglycerol:prolipoprotein diacylglycerol transferase
MWSPMTVLFEPGAMPEGENVRISQLLAVLIVIFGLLAIWLRRAKGYANVRYSDPIVSSKAVDGAGTEVAAGTDGTEEAAGSAGDDVDASASADDTAIDKN